MTGVIRAVSPASLRNVRAMVQPGISPSSLSSSRTSSIVASAGGRIRSDSSRESAVVGDADGRTPSSRVGSALAERLDVPGVDGGLDRGVVVVAAVSERRRRRRTAPRQDPCDPSFCPPSVVVSADSVRSPAFERLRCLRCTTDPSAWPARARRRDGSSSASSSRKMSSPAFSDEDTSSRAPEAISSSIAPARASGRAVLSLARWIAIPIAHLLPDPDMASPIRSCLRGRVGGLDRLLAGAEPLDLRLQPRRGEGELLLLAMQLCVLGL